MKADKFIDLVKRHTELAEFTPLLLNEFIEKVVVYEPVKKMENEIKGLIFILIS